MWKLTLFYTPQLETKTQLLVTQLLLYACVCVCVCACGWVYARVHCCISLRSPLKVCVGTDLQTAHSPLSPLSPPSHSAKGTWMT